MNKCIMLVQVPSNFKKSYNENGAQPVLFAPMTHRQYRGKDNDPEYTSVPFVFFGKMAETWNKTLRPGMRLVIEARYTSSYNAETSKSSHSFVVQDIDVAAWPKDGEDFNSGDDYDNSSFNDFYQDEEEDPPF